MDNRFTELVKESNRFRESKDCAVKAVAVVTGKPYKVAHAALKSNGRSNRCGTPRSVTISAIESLGFKVSLLDDKHAMRKAKTLRTLESKVPSRGMFLVCVKKHIIGVRAGMIQDWTEGRCNRIIEIYRVSQA
jgi:hypothetical protein